MTDLISRAAAIEEIKRMPYWFTPDGYCALTYDDIKAAINNAPAVDAAPIIRCASCKWWDKDQTTDGIKGFCPNTGCCEQPDFYCADGERRDSE